MLEENGIKDKKFLAKCKDESLKRCPYNTEKILDMYIIKYNDGSIPKVGKIYTSTDSEYWKWRWPDELSLTNNPGGGKLREGVQDLEKKKLNFTWYVHEYGKSNILF